MIADASGPYQRFVDAAIANDGTVVFQARRRDNGSEGIYLGPDPDADKLIEIGDSLFGSTLTGFQFAGSEALAGNGFLAIEYELANGIRGVATVTVPAPTTALALIPLVGFARRRR